MITGNLPICKSILNKYSYITHGGDLFHSQTWKEKMGGGGGGLLSHVFHQEVYVASQE